MTTLDNKLYEKQIEFETLSVTLGIDNYQRLRAEAETKGQAAALRPQQRLLQQAITPLSAAITEFVGTVLGGKVKRKARAAYLLDGLNPDMVAYITAQTILNNTSRDAKLTSVLRGIFNAIEDELYFDAFKKQHPALYNTLDKSMKTANKHKFVVMKRYAGKAGVDFENWTFSDKVTLAEWLVQTFISVTGLVEEVVVEDREGKSVSYLSTTAQTNEWLEKAHGQCELLAPVYLPMVVQPKPWTAPTDGGYMVSRLKMVKTFNKNYMQELANMEMPTVYAAVNAVQNTAWRINNRVRAVATESWANKLCLGGMPHPDGEALPPKPVEDMDAWVKENPEAHKQWKRERARAWEATAKGKSQRQSVNTKLWIAQEFAEFDALYFPHTLDWRGRIYPVVPHLNPQSDDLAKGLLMFSKGIPLTEEGVRWLAIHLSNTFGNDKCSLEEREQWAKEHSAEICLSAVDPYTYRFWEKADKPWTFLAACFEWNDYKTHGLGIMTHIPIALDGSNNGLQHLAAMRRDEIGGRVVNLVPCDKPADSYAEVAKVVERKLQLDDNPLAQLWRGKVDRSLVKRNVMTLCYGATKRGMLDQLVAELYKRADKKQALINMEDKKFVWEAASYLSKIIYDSIGNVVVAASAIMDWLQETAKIVASNNLPIHWVTPAGFHVLQSYKVTEEDRVQTHCGGLTVDRKFRQDTSKIDSRKQALGMSPNFVHSMDASHLMATVAELSVDYGMDSFAFIHDSYGTHAGEPTNTLARVLREKFIEMYTVDILATFVSQLKQQLPEELFAKLPALPPMGDLDLEAIIKSRYFFA